MWPKTVALLTSNALIIRHGTFHIFMKGRNERAATHESYVIDIFLFTVHSAFDEAHTNVAREKSHLTVLTLFSDFFLLPFLALLMETLFFVDFSFIFFRQFLLVSINSWHNSFFYILANGTTNELFSLPFQTRPSSLWKAFFWLFWCKNFHSLRADQQNIKRKLFDSRVKLQPISTAVEVGLTCWSLSLLLGSFFMRCWTQTFACVGRSRRERERKRELKSRKCWMKCRLWNEIWVLNGFRGKCWMFWVRTCRWTSRKFAKIWSWNPTWGFQNNQPRESESNETIV
jgi:hypothetical protein